MRLHPSQLLALLLAAPLPAQVFEETFTFPDGPVIPGWTQRIGSWSITNRRLVMTSGAITAYITRDGLSAKDCVVDGEFFHMGSGLQFAGLASRHPGTSIDNNLIMAKVQDNGTASGFDGSWVYERATRNAAAKTGLPPMQSARLRLISLDNKATVWLDTDSNGVFELEVGSITLVNVLGSGLVGMTGYQATEMDNFRYFDAVLVGKPNSTPAIGTTYTMQFRAPQPQGTLFVCAAALANTGIPVDTRKIPLAVDALLQMSLTTPSVFGFAGLLDGNGDGAPALHIPNDSALVGIAMFVSGFTLVAPAPSGIGHISNDHHVVIQ